MTKDIGKDGRVRGAYMTRKEFARIPRDYKTSSRDGYRSIMTRDTDGGTVLVPATMTCEHGELEKVRCEACEGGTT